MPTDKQSPPPATPVDGKKPAAYVRAASPKDYAAILDAAEAAFIHDPIMLYWGDVQRTEGSGLSPKDTKGLRVFIKFVMKSCASRGGRVNVVVMPDGDGQEKIVSSAFWFPPGKRIENYQVLKLYSAGGVRMVRMWGVGSLSRIGDQYTDRIHKIFVKAFRERGVKRSPHETWYLLMTFTHPEFQGQGCMSLLMKEQFAYKPKMTYILEATKEKTSNQYARFGFELQETFSVGVGKVGLDGLPASGKDATGVQVYPMIKWGETDIGSQ